MSQLDMRNIGMGAFVKMTETLKEFVKMMQYAGFSLCIVLRHADGTVFINEYGMSSREAKDCLGVFKDESPKETSNE